MVMEENKNKFEMPDVDELEKKLGMWLMYNIVIKSIIAKYCSFKCLRPEEHRPPGGE